MYTRKAPTKCESQSRRECNQKVDGNAGSETLSCCYNLRCTDHSTPKLSLTRQYFKITKKNYFYD